MKTKFLLLISVMLTAITVVAQDATNKKFSVPDIPFAKKLPWPDLTNYTEKSLSQMVNANVSVSIMPGNNISKNNAAHKSPEYFRNSLTYYSTKHPTKIFMHKALRCLHLTDY